MKALVRTLVLVGVTAGVSIALSAAARADVVEPRSAYQPASVGLLSEDAAAAMAEPKAEPSAVEEPAPPKEEPAPTPAPEQQMIRQIPAPVADARPAAPQTVVHRLIDPFRVGFEHIGASLGRVASACEVGLVTGPGGPVLVLAVLSIALPFVRRRISAIRRAADEAVPELLYAWKLTPPG